MNNIPESGQSSDNKKVLDCAASPFSLSDRPVQPSNDGLLVRTATEAESEENVENHDLIRSITWSALCQKLTLPELSGACGDFGTLIPLLVAMARNRTIYLAPTLFLSGIVHIVTGCYWDIPIPLQPMKAIASLAIAQELTRTQVTVAGVGMGVCFLLLSVKNMIDIVNRWIPISVIGGLQLGVGWKLALKGIKLIQGLPWWFVSSIDCITMSVLCGLLCLYGLKRGPQTVQQIQSVADTPMSIRTFCKSCWTQPPVGIVLFLIGISLATVQLVRHDQDAETQVVTSEPLITNALRDVNSVDWRIGILSGTLTQLPLTTLNSCLSLCLLAQTLFPTHKSHCVSRRSICISIGLVNCCLCPLGMMPTCHGAGGLAAQHRLGASSGVSMIILGLFKIFMGLMASQGLLLRVLDALPVSVLGVLLVLAGHELGATGVIKVATTYLGREGNRSDSGEDAMVVCMITALVIVGTGHTHVGALCGWIACAIYGGGEIPFRSCCSFRRDEHIDLEVLENANSRGEYSRIEHRSDA
ncbi:sulfate transporter [Nitzschia inconspicua]|uniref:Sulfate transporter n=1 Tax=Nitzschia inconspicua TaxID=303405 RepID=A0A9K3LH24_9STRA|nr:sulfate transporter [Nitzschia inconspicua]KAG7362270.1 sulfate transporter [Nitzschia inconspicua]